MGLALLLSDLDLKLLKEKLGSLKEKLPKKTQADRSSFAQSEEESAEEPAAPQRRSRLNNL